MDAYVNLATSTVATAPSPATSGTSLVVAAGTGTRYPAVPFDVTLYAPGTKPDPTNAEIARCTAVSTDTLTLTRAQYGTTAQPVAAGWYVDNDVTANFIGEMIALIPSPASTVVGPDSFGASAVVGTGTTFARADHNHGLPSAPADIPLSTVTTAGDLIVASGAGAVTRLGVGTASQVLLGGSTPTWGAAPAGAMQLIASNVLGVATASVTFSSIPGTYNHLKLIMVARSTRAAENDFFAVQFNGDTGSNYDGAGVNQTGGFGTTPATMSYAGHSQLGSNVSDLAAASATAGAAGVQIVDIPMYALTAFRKMAIFSSGYADPQTAVADTTTSGPFVGVWRNTAAITSITIFPNFGPDFVAGSGFYLYGIS